MSLKRFTACHRKSAAAFTFSAVAAILLTSCARPSGVAAADPVTRTPATPAYARPTGAFKLPDFPPGLTWFNVKQPLTMSSLHGKMVLLDFWTYG